MALVMIAPPAAEPVSLAELKEFLRVDAGDTSQDGTIAGLATSAWAWAEMYTRRAFVQQSWRLLMDFFPGYIDLKLAGAKVSSPFVSGSSAVLVGIRYAVEQPMPPAWRILSFKYKNANGNLTLMVDGADYVADLASNPARLTPPFGKMWPVARVETNAVQIEFQAGYAMPVKLNGPVGSPLDAYSVETSEYDFVEADIQRPISIPGAGADGRTLNTIIAAVSDPADGRARLRDRITTAVSGATALLVNNPNGNPRHWAAIQTGIKFRVKADFESLPLYVERAKQVLYPVRDLRL